MIDTVYIQVNKHPFNNSILINKSNKVCSETGRVISTTGHLKNLIVTTDEHHIYIKGSLPAYYYGCNAYTFNLYSLRKAIDKLSKEIGLNLNDGIITKLDIAGTFQVKRSIIHYYKFLADSPYYKNRFIDQYSLYYKNCNRTLNFYDKGKELKKKGSSIPERYREGNWMRFEVRYKCKYLKNLMTPYGKPNLTIEDLKNKEIYFSLLGEWAYEYRQIEKVSELSFDFSKLVEPKKVKDQLALIGLKNIGGLSKFNERIEKAKAVFPAPYPGFYSKVKKNVKDLSKNTEYTYEGDEVSELNRNIQNCLNEQVSSCN